MRATSFKFTVANPAVSRRASSRLPSCPRSCKPSYDPGWRDYFLEYSVTASMNAIASAEKAIAGMVFVT